MQAPFVLLGLNHRTAPVDLREKVVFQSERLPEALQALKERPGIRECAILSTCNRTELYAVTQEPEAQDTLAAFLAGSQGLSPAVLSEHFYLHRGAQAVTHLFSVSSGLDSMVVGENQILGQVRSAYEAARQAAVTGPLLDRLFPWAVRVGKRARSQTRIAQGASSVSAAAVELARHIFGDLSGRRLMLLGAGKMTELTLKLLSSAGVRQITVTNRTFPRAEELARQCGGEAVPFERLDRALADVDILIASTGAPHYVVTAERLQGVMRARRNRPLFLVDIAVPRDFEPSCSDLDNVYLYNIDDLQGVVAQNLTLRQKEVNKVLDIVRVEAEGFLADLDSRRASGAIRTLRESFEEIRAQEVGRYADKAGLSADETARLETFSRSLLNKLLHAPTLRLKQLGQAGVDPEELRRTLELLGLTREELDSEEEP
ncbi:MAG: glutamyl-tRNA reductase [Candidatus Eremiobacterota bacterium]